MNTGPQPLRHWLAAYAFIGLTVLGVFWMMDGITAYRAPVATVVSASPTIDPPRTGRVFILLLDSLRHQTAMDAGAMPALARLRASGVWAEVKPSYNAVTVPCVRAAFTGRDEVSVLGFLDNFLHGDAEIDSIFRRLAATGRRTAAFSHGGFTQFGRAIDPNLVSELSVNSEGVEAAEDAGVARMLALFHEQRHDVVIAHISYTDYAAHKYRVGTPNYRRDFRRADKLVALAAASVGAADTLIVMGDHGHAEDGSHTLGQDVPTCLLYRGPKFKAGHDLGRVDIMAHTWLLGAVFGLAPPADYTGGDQSDALAGPANPVVRVSGNQETKVLAAPRGLWIYQALLALFGAGLIWPARAPWMRRPEARWVVWLALPAALAPLPWNAWIGAPVGLVTMAWLLRGSRPRAWLLVAAALLFALGWHEWGRLLAGWREYLHAITRGQLAASWLVAGVAAMAVATRANRSWVAVFVAAVGFMTVPTNYRYGFTGLMIPFLWIWLAAYAASLVREKQLGSWRAAGWIGCSAVAIFAFTQLFAGVEAVNFIFRGFVPVVSFRRYGFEALMFLGIAAKLVIFFPTWPRRWLPAVAAVVCIGGLQHVQWRTWEPGPWMSLGVIAGLLAGWGGWRRRDPELAQVMLLALLFFLYAFCVLPHREAYARADCVLAALVLAARWLRRFPQPENLAADYLGLATVALLAAGYFTANWSVEGLEWSRIYTWFPAHVVESALGAALLVPWLVLKTSLPLFVAQRLLGRELRALAPWPGESLRRLVGGKILTLLLVVTGLGVTGAVNVVYLEGVQQLTILAILSVGLLFGSASRVDAGASVDA